MARTKTTAHKSPSGKSPAPPAYLNPAFMKRSSCSHFNCSGEKHFELCYKNPDFGLLVAQNTLSNYRARRDIEDTKGQVYAAKEDLSQLTKHRDSLASELKAVTDEAEAMYIKYQDLLKRKVIITKASQEHQDVVDAATYKVRDLDRKLENLRSEEKAHNIKLSTMLS